jgi:hypothetical protein
MFLFLPHGFTSTVQKSSLVCFPSVISSTSTHLPLFFGRQVGSCTWYHHSNCGTLCYKTKRYQSLLRCARRQGLDKANDVFNWEVMQDLEAGDCPVLYAILPCTLYSDVSSCDPIDSPWYVLGRRLSLNIFFCGHCTFLLHDLSGKP